MTKTKSVSSPLSPTSTLPKHTFYNPNRRRSIHKELSDIPADAITQQQFKGECDMNRIVANAQRGIEPSHLARGVPQYGDFSEVPDLATAYNLIKDAEEAFLNLPSELRLELGNDPARLNELTHDQARRFKLLRADHPAMNPPQTIPSPADPAPKAVQADPKAPKSPSTD